MSLRINLILAAGVLAQICWSQVPAGVARTSPHAYPRIGKVDDRYQSYNVEMVEVIGGKFWMPYKDIAAMLEARKSAAGAGPVTPPRLDELHQSRPPIDLSNPRLRKLAAALGPAYMRVSGTWANDVYFHNSDAPAPSKPPEGFGGVLTRAQWKGVVDFARAVNAKLVTSFAISSGTRDAAGLWTPVQAHAFVEYTKSAGGSIAAAEFMNEPTFPDIGSAPKGYDPAAFGRDVAAFVPFLRSALPGAIFLGPDSVGEGVNLGGAGSRIRRIPSDALLQAAGPVFDAFAYHSYPAASKRCSGADTAEGNLTEPSLSRAVQIQSFYAGLRDKYLPGRPLWLTETADAACGGNPWAPTFADSLRYADQLGRLAKLGVQVHMHNTLASSDYGLLEDETFLPRPNYWTALMWHKFMGTTVLDAGSSPAQNLHVYAHCLQGKPGGVALLAINADQRTTAALAVPLAADRYTLSATHLEDRIAQLNGQELRLGDGDAVPEWKANHTAAGSVEFAPLTITLLAMPAANNASCR